MGHMGCFCYSFIDLYFFFKDKIWQITHMTYIEHAQTYQERTWAILVIYSSIALDQGSIMEKILEGWPEQPM